MASAASDDYLKSGWARILNRVIKIFTPGRWGASLQTFVIFSGARICDFPPSGARFEVIKAEFVTAT